jgi:hypothetical protein
VCVCVCVCVPVCLSVSVRLHRSIDSTAFDSQGLRLLLLFFALLAYPPLNPTPPSHPNTEASKQAAATTTTMAASAASAAMDTKDGSSTAAAQSQQQQQQQTQAAPPGLLPWVERYRPRLLDDVSAEFWRGWSEGMEEREWALLTDRCLVMVARCFDASMLRPPPPVDAGRFPPYTPSLSPIHPPPHPLPSLPHPSTHQHPLKSTLEVVGNIIPIPKTSTPPSLTHPPPNNPLPFPPRSRWWATPRRWTG